MNDISVDQVIKQWESFCDQLKVSGASLLEQSAELDAVSQADALRYLTRLLRGGIEKYIEYGDPFDPVIYKVYHEKLKWGGDNPDSIYSMSAIDGRVCYQVTGHRGTINYFNISSMKMGADGKLVTTGFIDCDDFQCADDGSFVLQIGGEKCAGNWLAVEPDSNFIMIRQTFRDRSREQELTATIAAPGQANKAQGLKLDTLMTALASAESFFVNTGKTFIDLSQSMFKQVNRLPPVDLDYITSMGGDPNYTYFWSGFQVSSGQALLIHLPYEPECDTWSLCLHNYWLESLDYHKSRIILNKYTALKNSDGSITMAVSMDDPGIENWLDSCGHSIGQMIFRWTKAREVVAPQVALVDLDSVDWSTRQRRWQ